jgi:hypothetical protein
MLRYNRSTAQRKAKMRMKSSAEIRRELALAEEREHNEKEARRKANPPKFTYWIVPASPEHDASFIYGKLYDPTCHLYSIERRITNKDAAKAAGWPDLDLREGSATYVYNVVTRRIICAVGGGTVYISCGNGFDREDYADDNAMFAIGNYLAEYPGGGEITWIYEQFRAERKLAANGNKSVTS